MATNDLAELVRNPHSASALARVRHQLAAAARTAVKPSAEESEIINAYQQLSAEHATLSAQAAASPIAAIRNADALLSLERRLQMLWPSYQRVCAGCQRNRAEIEALEAEERSYLTTFQIAEANLAAIDAEEREALAGFEQRRAEYRKAIARVCGNPDTPALASERAEKELAERAQQVRATALWLLNKAAQHGSQLVEEQETAVRRILHQMQMQPVSPAAVETALTVLRPIVHQFEAA